MNSSAWLPEITESEIRLASALADMAIGRGGTFDDYQTPVYLRGLADLDVSLLERACRLLALEKRAEFEPVVPSIGVIRERAEQIGRQDTAQAAAAKLLPAPKREGDEPTYFCHECHDEPNGWRIFWCRGAGVELVVETRDRGDVFPCARKDKHKPHAYADRCKCLPYNPVIAKARERQRAFVDRKAQA